jgi:hypothetical protein
MSGAGNSNPTKPAAQHPATLDSTKPKSDK